MSYFHSRFVRSRGGKLSRPMRRVLGETIAELRYLVRAHPESAKLTLPPRGREGWRSKSLPCGWIDADRQDILDAVESVEVSEEHLRVLTWLLRREFYELHGDGTRDEWFKKELRGNLFRLLRSGEWVDDPGFVSLQKFQDKLRNFDLGRRSDLNFSSEQGDNLKYEFKPKDDSAYLKRRRAMMKPPTVEEKDLSETRPWLKD